MVDRVTPRCYCSSSAIVSPFVPPCTLTLFFVRIFFLSSSTLSALSEQLTWVQYCKSVIHTPKSMHPIITACVHLFLPGCYDVFSLGHALLHSVSHCRCCVESALISYIQVGTGSDRIVWLPLIVGMLVVLFFTEFLSSSCRHSPQRDITSSLSSCLLVMWAALLCVSVFISHVAHGTLLLIVWVINALLVTFLTHKAKQALHSRAVLESPSPSPRPSAIPLTASPTACLSRPVPAASVMFKRAVFLFFILGFVQSVVGVSLLVDRDDIDNPMSVVGMALLLNAALAYAQHCYHEGLLENKVVKSISLILLGVIGMTGEGGEEKRRRVRKGGQSVSMLCIVVGERCASTRSYSACRVLAAIFGVVLTPQQHFAHSAFFWSHVLTWVGIMAHTLICAHVSLICGYIPLFSVLCSSGMFLTTPP